MKYITALISFFGIFTLSYGAEEQALPKSFAEAQVFLATNLAQCASVAEVKPRCAAFIEIKGGGWIAFTYCDEHLAPGNYSCAVALTSDGDWLVSDYHFCAILGSYSPAGDRGTKADSPRYLTFCALDDAVASPSMSGAIRVLERIKFRRFDGPVAKTTKRANQALQHNDPSCHGSCLRTLRANWGRG